MYPGECALDQAIFTAAVKTWLPNSFFSVNRPILVGWRITARFSFFFFFFFFRPRKTGRHFEKNVTCPRMLITGRHFQKNVTCPMNAHYGPAFRKKRKLPMKAHYGPAFRKKRNLPTNAHYGPEFRKVKNNVRHFVYEKGLLGVTLLLSKTLL